MRYVFYWIVLILIGLLPSCTSHKANSRDSRLIDVALTIPGIYIDLKYATSDNFTGQVVYDFQNCLLHKATVYQLQKVQAELETMGLSLKIWDGYRPFYAQWKFWELVPDPRYVSNPQKGGRHTRGTAVDLTLVTKEGQALPMPSEFDDFTKRAHRDYAEASQEATQNRELLRQVMEKHGFIGLPTEWWHFDLVGWEDYPPIKEKKKKRP